MFGLPFSSTVVITTTLSSGRVVSAEYVTTDAATNPKRDPKGRVVILQDLVTFTGFGTSSVVPPPARDLTTAP
jgi:hypothetical protein